ncbi:MAG: coproporphyrinogen dehydrogenase HemZ [Ruminococcaceae bacterium]|nr:coproporphyrinogen dehydrogenase HemZ [Oscillospiraceae bacterium]
MKLCCIGQNFKYELEKLARIFLPFEKIEMLGFLETAERYAVVEQLEKDGTYYANAKLFLDGKSAEKSLKINPTDEEFSKVCERVLATALFDCFIEITGYKPEWGILTGVRPAKLFSRLSQKLGVPEACDYFERELKVSKNKISLCMDAVRGESAITSLSKADSFSLYISVPFCPTRCSYCSFVSHSVEQAKKLIPEYVELLCREIEYTGKFATDLGLKLSTVYIGGGTPTTLSAEQLDTVMKTVAKSFDTSGLLEYTVEAGRPDTITREKLVAIRDNGATRISINPQTMQDSVLEAIGRRHTADECEAAFLLARSLGFNNINMDLIAGLPTDTFEGFKDTLERILKLDPESVTVHSLSMKRASSLSVNDNLPEIKVGIEAAKMVDFARETLSQRGIIPYYMYRQSKTVGNLENVGYAKEGFEGLYNVYIMDETHTILACGASAVTKLREPKGDYISRIFNFKYPYEYINRFDEQLSRKDGIKEFYEEYSK